MKADKKASSNKNHKAEFWNFSNSNHETFLISGSYLYSIIFHSLVFKAAQKFFLANSNLVFYWL